MTQRQTWLRQRRAGVLLHPTSLPGPGPLGDLGDEARRFVDFLADSGFSVWQMLPVGPVHKDLSPYGAQSSFAGHTGLLGVGPLREQGLVPAGTPTPDARDPERRTLVARALETFRSDADSEQRRSHERFLEQHRHWLPDYALFRVLRRLHGDRPWYRWPAALRRRDSAELDRVRAGNEEAIELECFGQYLFFEQWSGLSAYARQRGIELFGDMPIYVAHDSADTWCWRHYFTLNANGHRQASAGVPPDAFSATGQLWGNPLYRWEKLAEEDYRWWIDRFDVQCRMFSMLRIDHFRAFDSYFEVPPGARTAEKGRWRAGPGRAVFDAVFAALGPLRLVAEDLGDITTGVEALRRELGFPGMRVLQFAFDGGEDNPHRPANHVPDAVVYTGTHDNDTTLGWWESLDGPARTRVLGVLGRPDEPMPVPMIRVALESESRLAVIPMQDLLGLDSRARMNMPGTKSGNWRWRFQPEQISPGLVGWARNMLHETGRFPQGEPEEDQ